MSSNTGAITRRTALGGGFGLLAGAQAALAQQEPVWPDRPVRLINSGAAGSGIDLLARLLSDGLAGRFGQPFPVENRPGAGSVLAAQTHAATRPGESLLLGATGIASTVPYTFTGRLTYDPDADLVPIAIPASEFLCIASNSAVPAQNLAALVDYAKARPGSVNWNSVPGYVELDTRLFLHQRGLNTTFVAYSGSPPAVLDLAAGRIQFAVLPLTPLLGSIREGKIRPLAVTSGIRTPSLPDVPTVAEAGFEELRYDPFTGLFGWRGITDPVRDRIAKAVTAIMTEPAVVERLRQAGIHARHGTAAELAQVIASQRARVQEAVQVVGLRQG